MISPEQVQEIAAAVKGRVLNETAIASLRAEYPGMHFTYCLDDDISNHEPVLECGTFNLYLVDGREHCLRFTSVHEYASGIVIAEVIDE